MIKTHKICLKPDQDQVAWFYSQCGYAKFAYNQALSDFKTELASDTSTCGRQEMAKQEAHDFRRGSITLQLQLTLTRHIENFTLNGCAQEVDPEQMVKLKNSYEADFYSSSPIRNPVGGVSKQEDMDLLLFNF